MPAAGEVDDAGLIHGADHRLESQVLTNLATGEGAEGRCPKRGAHVIAVVPREGDPMALTTCYQEEGSLPSASSSSLEAHNRGFAWWPARWDAASRGCRRLDACPGKPW